MDGCCCRGLCLRLWLQHWGQPVALPERVRFRTGVRHTWPSLHCQVASLLQCTGMSPGLRSPLCSLLHSAARSGRRLARLLQRQTRLPAQKGQPCPCVLLATVDSQMWGLPCEQQLHSHLAVTALLGLMGLRPQALSGITADRNCCCSSGMSRLRSAVSLETSKRAVCLWL